MPQDYSEMMDPKKNAIEFLSKEGSKEENTKIRTYLGSVNFTKEEMFHPVDKLSGGQRAKLYFSKMILNQVEVLLLDEPTRNLSPLSGPEVRQALKNFTGCIIAVSHDRKFIKTVFDEVLELDHSGLRPVTI
jgi:ATPase subunit of ABC transporter with duplicated ATPase domains